MANKSPKITCPKCGRFMAKLITMREPHYDPARDVFDWYECDEYICRKCRRQETVLILVEQPSTSPSDKCYGFVL